LRFTIDLARCDAASHRLGCAVLPEPAVQGDNRTCFATASGTLDPPPGARQVSLRLERVSGTACAGRELTVRIVPVARRNSEFYARYGTVRLN
jgi:hypothetical protein